MLAGIGDSPDWLDFEAFDGIKRSKLILRYF